MDHRGIKAITHASTFFAPILVPLLVWLLISDRYVKNTALQALFFHIIMGVLIAISIPFCYILIGIPFFIVFSLVALYYPIKGILYSLSGRPFAYPILGSLFR
ncbi:DUF4870 domain-containing protein [Brevibacillus ruminantium]|uniref:DUF4870 domain-containing protein n=1 Tax=Brevibacillus ruminantium TaxID=2950604 RepID=A0ABY4WGN7_9BACL|nr:DUF4870 domain-containing protein [Brevibacillus ruminantium]USG65864.1 DUF4870 domain-containing protein [Brevibacillus ruminantium]